MACCIMRTRGWIRRNDLSESEGRSALLTVAGIVPDGSFTLQAGAAVRITLPGIATMENPVVVV